jgi:TPR repeat protein
MAASNANQAGRALQLMEKCAEEGDPAACYMTALWYREGEGAPVNEQRSAHWIARLVELAEQGNLKAQWEVEQSYRFGNLLPYDIERANAWMERAASGGCGKEQHQLGWSYEHGQNGYPVDLAKATMWYQRAFEQEHPETLYLFAIRQFVDGKPTQRQSGY